MKPRILFMVKCREGYDDYYGDYTDCHPHPPVFAFSSGLYNSARYAQELLLTNGFPAYLVEVIDGNDIDREVTKYNPDVVIIEALWVTPDKLAENVRLHPTVEWIVRLHSEVPFLAVEGMAIDWIKGYWGVPHVFVSTNTEETRDDMYLVQQTMDLGFHRIPLLPTYVPVVQHSHLGGGHPRVVNVCCPGAQRPLKNQLTQAVAALRYAEDHRKTCHFYVNTTVSADGGINMLKNLMALFRGTRHELVQIAWKTHNDFIRFLREMDIGLQVSFSESMNLCLADLVCCRVPSVASDQIRWSNSLTHASCTSSVDIAKKMDLVVRHWEMVTELNLLGLEQFSLWASRLWLAEFAR